MTAPEKTMAELLAKVSELSTEAGRLRAKMAESEDRAVRCEAALRETRERFQSVLETIPDYLFSATMVDGTPRYDLISPGVTKTTGYTPEEHRSDPWLWLSYTHEEDRPMVRRALDDVLSGKGPGTLEFRIVRKDGTVRWVRTSVVPVPGATGRVVRVDGIVSDTTDRREIEESNRRLQEQLFNTGKMQALGTLAGGIAHDFNNVLGVILGYTSLTKSRIDTAHPLYKALDTIEKSAERAAELTRQLLGFARAGKFRAEPVILNRVADRVLSLLRGSLDRSIVVESSLDPGLPPTEGDVVQLEHVLMNLCLNARDAMPTGGKLRIETAPETLGEAFTATRPWARKGDFVRLTVSDTGVGMTPETMERMFEPFFTTKEPGKGSGMGLAMVYGAVKNHGGFIDAQSAPGAGTSVHLYFPVSWRSSPARSGPSANGEVRGGTETILVVDPDPAYMEVSARALEGAGYRVLRAATGEEACARLLDGGIALAVLDVRIPGMGIKRTFLTLASLRPGLPVLVATGQGVEGTASEMLQMGASGFVEKSCRVGDLLREVRRAIDSK